MLPLVSDWRYRCLTERGPYLHFTSYGSPGYSIPWIVEHGMCRPGGDDRGDLKPLTDRNWKNFLKTLDAIGAWNGQ